MLSFFDKQLLKGCGPWSYRTRVLYPAPSRRRPSSIILLHGFGGSPFDMKNLGQSLRGSGFRVVIPALPGQTWKTPISKRGLFTADYYIGYVRKILEREKEKTGCRPSLAGFSMGGALSCITAMDAPVKRLVLIAPFFKLPGISDSIWKISRRLESLIPCVPKLSKGKINDPSGYRQYFPGSYFVSLPAFTHLGVLAKKARKSVSNIKVPTLVFLSENDRVACSKTAGALLKANPNARIVLCNKSDHILLYDYHSKQIIRQITAFFSQN